MKALPIILTAIALHGCASAEKMPDTQGKRTDANSIETNAMLAAAAGYVFTGDERDKPAVKKALLRNGLAFPDSPADYTQIATTRRGSEGGAMLVKRMVVVGFKRGEKTFDPDESQAFHLRQLYPVAKYFVVSGYTTCRKCTEADRQTARIRAESGKRYLTDAGVPPSAIQVNYDVGSTHVKYSDQDSMADFVRRVTVEAVVDLDRS